MHTKPMAETDGTFAEPEERKYNCRQCARLTAVCRKWESSDGAYEDYKYECSECGYYWWVEGIDS